LAINLIIGNEEEVKTWTNDERNLRQLQQRACEKLLNLIQRNREVVEPIYFPKPNKWNQVEKSRLMSPFIDKSLRGHDGNEYFLNLHHPLALSSDRS